MKAPIPGNEPTSFLHHYILDVTCQSLVYDTHCSSRYS